MQRILMQTGQGANYYIRQSLVNTFRVAGYQTYFWDDSAKSAFDVFSEFDPELVISSTWQLNRPMVKCLNDRPQVKVILWADIWGSIEKDLDVQKYPVGIATDEQKQAVSRLSQVPFIISNHGPKDVEATHGGWRNEGCKPESLLVSADVTQYKEQEVDKNYQCQLTYTGGYWPYKSVNLDKYILPLTYPNTKWAIRLFGSGWNVVNGIGNISNVEAAKFYRNACITPHVVEPHCSDLYQDLPLRYFEVAACAGFGISCPVVGIRDIFDENELVVASDPEDFIGKVVHYLNNPDETFPFREAARRKVLLNHTGFHRAKQLLEMIGEDTTSVDKNITQIAFDLTGY